MYRKMQIMKITELLIKIKEFGGKNDIVEKKSNGQKLII